MTTLLAWLQANSVMLTIAVVALILVFGKKLPSIQTWQAFLDSFESKGGQLMLLWATNFILLAILVHYWALFDAHAQTIIVGLLSGVNGAFLGAIGSKNPPIAGGPPVVESPAVPPAPPVQP